MPWDEPAEVTPAPAGTGTKLAGVDTDDGLVVGIVPASIDGQPLSADNPLPCVVVS